ncbi:SufE family protein [Serratia sp. 2723]|uniref:SufE family protein n=1 Tax=unclassified Serratia (in: enterobacteria) TaxID=2647522 RepID=UPI003D192217
MNASIVPDFLMEKAKNKNTLKEKYLFIISCASSLPGVPLGSDAIKLSNCQNTAYLSFKILDEKTVYFYGSSDSRLIEGLMAILLLCLNGNANTSFTKEDIYSIFTILGIQKQFLESLPMGMGLIVDEVLKIISTKSEAVV